MTTNRGCCPRCNEPITGVATMTTLSAATILARYQDAPPTAVPDDALSVSRIVEPCGHEVSLVQLREAGIEIERYEHP